MDEPYTRQELRDQEQARVDRERLGPAEQPEQETNPVKQELDTYFVNLQRVRENLDERIKALVNDREHPASRPLGRRVKAIMDLEWSILEKEMGAHGLASARGGSITDAQRWKLLGAMQHAHSVLLELQKTIPPEQESQK